MKIGIARYPYLQPSLKGGDLVLFDQIAQALAQRYQVTEISYARPWQPWVMHVPGRFRNALIWLIELFIAPLFTLQLLRNRNDVDILIADSAVVTHLACFGLLQFKKAPVVVPVINIDYHAYQRKVPNKRIARAIIAGKLREYWQARGARRYPGVAVSEYVAATYTEKSFPVLRVIPCVVSVPVPATAARAPSRRYCYAGSSDYYGKGIDELQRLAAMGVEIHAYTPVAFNGLVHHLPLPRSQLLAELQDYDLLILPSRYESFGLITVEAMAMGIPVIMRPTGVGLELQKEIPECIVAAEDWATEAAKRIQLICSERERFSQMARQFALRYLNSDDYQQH